MLDILDDILTRVVVIEKQYNRIDCEMSEIKKQLQVHTNNFTS